MAHDDSFLSRALALVANGYRIIPIYGGRKNPGIDDWPDCVATPDLVRQWAKEGFKSIGIITRENPAIDLDIYDASMAAEMEAWCLETFGDTMTRVGRAPKRLLIYSTSTPFTKLDKTYRDPTGVKHKVEILGDGQQFVAYGIHPDTKAPFTWTSLDEPTTLDALMLPELTREDGERVLAKFDELATARGWTLGSGASKPVNGQLVSRLDDDALLNIKPTLRVTDAELADALGYVDGADDHDRWIMIGMALHHQYLGGDEGLELWHTWSATASNYDAEELDKRWESFSAVPDGHVAVTVATIFKIAKDNKTQRAEEEFQRVLNLIRTAKTESDLFRSVAKEVARVVTDDYQLDIVTKKMQDQAFELSKVKPRLETVRKVLASFKPKTAEYSGNVPDWCKGWVYLKTGDRFYNVDTKVEVTERGFNASYNREIVREEDLKAGIANPSSNASTVALNNYRIPVVHSTVYLPGHPKLLEIDGKLRANTFDETSIPPSRLPQDAADQAIIDTVEKHFRVLFEDPFERNMVLDYLAYNVQFPAEKIIWGLVIQGTEGAGKTWMQLMMKAALGVANIKTLNATTLKDTFTEWAEGSKMVFIEEIRLHGTNRYEVLDKMKIYVTNEDIPVRHMHRPQYQIPNVTNYVMYTNYWDALPLSLTDRRYFVVGTSFQTLEEVNEFTEANPQHFATLYEAVYSHGDLLRGWLMGRKLTGNFRPKAPAPDSAAKRRMRDESDLSDDGDVLADLLEVSTNPLISNTLLCADTLREKIEEEGSLCPQGHAFKSMLSRAGFHLIGRYRLGGASEKKGRFYTKTPKFFKKGFEIPMMVQYISEYQQKLLSAPVEEDDGLGP